jgi:MFS family permease
MSQDAGSVSVNEGASISVDIATERRDSVAHPPDGGHGWIVVLASALVILTVTGTMYSFGIIYEIISEQTDWSTTMLSFIGTTEYALFALISSPAGLFCDLYGPRKCMFISTVLLSLGMLLSSFATSEWVLFLTYSISFGTGAAFMLISFSTIISEYFSTKRVIAMSLSLSAIGIGMICVSESVVWLAEDYSWRVAFRWLSFAQLLVCSFASWAYIPLNLSSRVISGRATVFEVSKLFDFQLLRKKSFLILFIGSLFMGFAYYISFIYVIIYAMEDKGLSLSQAAFLLIVVGISDTLSRLILSYTAEGTASKRFAVFSSSIVLLSISFLVLPFFCDLLLSYSFTVLCVFSACYGAFYSSYVSLEPIIIADLVSLGNFSRAYGLYGAIQAIGYVLSSWIGSELQGSYGSASVLTFIGVVFGVAAVLTIWSRYVHDDEEQTAETILLENELNATKKVVEVTVSDA